MDFSSYTNKPKTEVRYFTMPAKFDSKCFECKADIEKGDTITFDGKERKAYCESCGKDLLL